MSPAELRALGRLGRRTARREWRRTLLITILVAVPVAASLVVAGLVQANEVTPEERLASTFGAADVKIELSQVGHAERMQAWVEGTLQDLAPDAQVQTYRQTYDVTLGEVTDLDLDASVARGMLVSWEGRQPEAADEVAMSPRLLQRLEVSIGDTISVADRELTVVGSVVDDVWYSREISVVAPELLPVLHEGAASQENVTQVWLVAGVDEPGRVSDEFQRAWERIRGSFLPEPAVSPTPAELATLPPEIYASLDADAVATLVELAPSMDAWELEDLAWQLADHGSVAWTEPWITNREWEGMWSEGLSERLMTPGVVGTLVAGVLLAEVALVAGAAYATGARRRLRELGLLSANGATVWHVRTAILGEAIVAGVLGALAGIALGIATLGLGKPLIQPLVSRYLVGLPLTVGAIAGPAIAGLVAVTAAAWLPARNAARVSTTTALQGRMPLSAPPRWLVPGGIGIGGFGALMTTVALAAGGDGASGVLAVIGILTTIIGTALLTPPIIAGIGRLADRLPATWRLVIRDSTRQRTRAAAATAAAMVLLMAPVLIGFASASDEARQQVLGFEQPLDQVAVAPTGWMDGRPAPYGVFDASVKTQPKVDARATADVVAELLPHAHRVEVPLLPIWATPATAPEPDDVAAFGYGGISPQPWQIASAVGTAEVAEALGDPRIGAALRDGIPVVLGVRERDTSVTLEDGTVLASKEVPLAVAWSFPRLLLPPGSAEELGFWPSMELTLFTGAQLDDDLESTLWQVTSDVGDGAILAVGWQRVTPQMIRWIAVGATLLVALFILGLVTALSSTESDHDLRTMVAVGAAPRMRRRFLAIQTGYHALIGALLAVPLGAGLYWAAVRGDGWPSVGPFGMWMSSAIAVPWTVLLAVIVGVPALIAVLTSVLFRSAPTVAPRRLG